MATILICGFGTRLIDLTDPPLDYAATRQLRSAMIARGMYYASLDNVPEWKLEIAHKQQSAHNMIEPEIIEAITVAIYHLAGGEYVWIARIYSSLFWVLGGLALYYLTCGMVSQDGGVAALIYYLFAPFGLVASRTFQPDPLMTAMIVTSWMAFYYWYQNRTWKWAIFAGLAAGAALFIKSTSVFFLLPGMGLIVLTGTEAPTMLKDLQTWVIAFLAGIPVIAYHVYGVFISGELERQFSGRFFPQLWDDADFYLGWLDALNDVAGHYVLLLIGLGGIFLIKNRRDWLFILALWAGYLAYGFGFSYHISTHKYYNLPVIPLLAISLGGAADWMIRQARRKRLDPLLLAGTFVILALGVAGGYYIFSREDYRHEPPYYQKIANFVDPEDKVVALSQDYGYRLSFYGWRAVRNWKGSEDLDFISLQNSELDPFSERFAIYSANYDYFIVTRMEELRRQSQLHDELFDHYAIAAQGGGYVIFDLRERLD